MIERDMDEGGFYVSCDYCTTDINIQQEDFYRMLEALKMRGWKSIQGQTRHNGTIEWLHMCPECQKKHSN